MSQSAFWGFLAACQKNVQKMSGKCPGAGAGAGKMSRKCQKKCPQTFSRHFYDIFWPIEVAAFGRHPKGGARAPFWLSIGQKMLKKCLENVWRHFWNIFLTFSGHFSSANPSTRTFSAHFLDIFLGGCREAPKGTCLLYTSPSPRDRTRSRMPSSA